MAYGPQSPTPQPPYGPQKKLKMHPGLLSALIAVPIALAVLIGLAVIGSVAGPPERTAAPTRT
jgi:hypothetical protein